MDSKSAIDPLFAVPPYSLPQREKSARLLEELLRLTEHHRRSCELYRRMLDASQTSRPAEVKSLADLPFLPVRLFKELELQSVPAAEVVKTLTSSGTTSQRVSRIAVDRETSLLQTRALAEIVKSFIGPQRLPMIIVDCPATAAKSSSLTARGAGVVGLSNFGRDHFYALDAEMRLDRPGLDAFLAKHAAGPILIFGFTFMVWEYLCEALRKEDARLSIPQAVLIHSGRIRRPSNLWVDSKATWRMSRFSPMPMASVATRKSTSPDWYRATWAFRVRGLRLPITTAAPPRWRRISSAMAYTRSVEKATMALRRGRRVSFLEPA